MNPNPPPYLILRATQSSAEQSLPAACIILAATYERGEPGVVARDSITAASLRAIVNKADVGGLEADLREIAEGYGGSVTLEGRALLEVASRLGTTGRAY